MIQSCRLARNIALTVLLVALSAAFSQATCAQDPSSTTQPATAPASESPSEAPPMAIPRPRPDGRVQLTLRDGSVLVGKLADDESIALQAVVGKVDVPMNEIMSVHFGDDGKSQVVFRNGDTLTGKLQLTEVRLTTSWAEVRIPTKELVKLFSSTYIASLGNGYRQVIERTPEGAQVRFEAIVPPTASYPSDPYGAPVPSAGPYSVPQSGYSAPAAPAAPLRPSPPPVIYGTHPG